MYYELTEIVYLTQANSAKYSSDYALSELIFDQDGVLINLKISNPKVQLEQALFPPPASGSPLPEVSLANPLYGAVISQDSDRLVSSKSMNRTCLLYTSRCV